MNFRKGEYLFALGLFAWICMVSGVVYARDSDLDPDFGTNGVATVNFGPNDWRENGLKMVGDIALQADGKIVQVGSYLPYYGSDFAVVRYTSTGVLDTSFDGDGKVITDLFSTPTTKYSEDVATSVAIQSDGKIIVAGSSRTDANGITSPNFNEGTSWMWWNVALARYNTNGSLDTTFGTNGNGKVQIDVANAGTADAIDKIALQGDGKIVAVGYTMSGSNNRFLIIRFNSDGTLDTSFNTTGTKGYRIEHFAENTTEAAKTVAIQPDGNIVVAGYGWRPDGKRTISILRLTSAGLLDTTFSGDGKLVQLVGGNSEAYSVLIDSDSKILVGGYTRDIPSDTDIFLLVRYNSNGTLDATFDTDGIVSTPFEGTSMSVIRGLALQTDGKIVAYGWAADVDSSDSSDLVLARYNTNGSLDTTFDSGDGKIRTDLSVNDTAANVVLQPDGKIMVSASRRSDDNAYTMLAALRYGNPTVDLTMGVSPAGAGTTTPPTGTSIVSPSTPQAISATAYSTHYFVNWTTSGPAAIVVNPNAASTSVSLTGNATVTANFSPLSVVNPSVIGKGLIAPSIAQRVKPGLTTQFTLSPDININNVGVLGSCPVGTLSDNGDGTWHYTTGIIAGDCSVIAYFGLLGDVNNDGFVNLADVILALQAVAGIDSAGIGTDNDVNGDSRVGLAEAIYILQKTAGVR